MNLNKRFTASTMMTIVVFAATTVVSIDRALGALINVTMTASRATLGTDASNIIPPPPGSILQLKTSTALLNLPSPAPDPMDRVLNYQPTDPPTVMYTIHQDNATTFGFDWSAFENSLNGRNKGATLNFGDSSKPPYGTQAFANRLQAVGNPPNLPPGFAGVSGFVMSEIRVTVDYYFWHPVLPSLRATKISFAIDGSGNPIPEPATLIMAVPIVIVFACSIGNRVRRTRRAFARNTRESMNQMR
jgi:hypothetical protein